MPGGLISEMKTLIRSSGLSLFLALLAATTIAGSAAYADLNEVETSEEQTSQATNELYPKRELLLFEEMSFDIPPGAIVGVIGPNGRCKECGKPCKG